MTILSPCLCILPSTFECLPTPYEIWYICHDTEAHVYGAIQELLASVCVSVRVDMFSVLGNVSVKTFPRHKLTQHSKIV
jgi:hypothetical protein